MSKIEIIKDFKDLAQLWKKARKTKSQQIVPGRDEHRQTAYQKAATALCAIPGDTILSLVIVQKGKTRPDGSKAPRKEVYITTNEVSNMKARAGLGPATTDKIKEYIRSGRIEAAETARKWLRSYADIDEKQKLDSNQGALKIFKGIFNVGDKTAQKWLEQYERTSKQSRIHPLTWVKNNEDKLGLSHSQRIGVKYYYDLQKRIPRHYIDIMQMIIHVVFSQTFGMNSYKMAVAGSYRRGAQDSGDIDVIFTSNKFDLKQAVAALEKWGVITDTMSVDNQKFTGICHCPSGQWFYFHLDLVYTTAESWDAALLWFTGSKSFNISTRDKAKQKGYVLNQYGLFRKKDTRYLHPIALREKDILEAIGEPYIPPECR